jgi:flavin-binding protein dodecin
VGDVTKRESITSEASEELLTRAAQAVREASYQHVVGLRMHVSRTVQQTPA